MLFQRNPFQDMRKTSKLPVGSICSIGSLLSPSNTASCEENKAVLSPEQSGTTRQR